MSNKILLAIALLFSFLGAGVAVYNFYKQPRIAYVRSQELVEKFAGTKEGLKDLDAMRQQWQSNVDTLSSRVQYSVDAFNKEARFVSNARREEMKKQIETQRAELMNYSSAVDERAQEENAKVMQGILTQINSYVAEYGKRNGYDIILGTTVSGNVLYGDEYLDVTEDILRGLNESYLGKKE